MNCHLAARDRTTAVEQSCFPRDSRLCAASINPELYGGQVFARKLIVTDEALSETEVMAIPF